MDKKTEQIQKIMAEARALYHYHVKQVEKYKKILEQTEDFKMFDGSYVGKAERNTITPGRTL